ncbi:MAG: FosX/FosE/FosI family fosfomycin resistance thiol transferase [Syntrophomonas sp.]
MTFLVKDLERAADFFIAVFEARQIYNSEDNPESHCRERFLMLNDLWICIMEGEPLVEQTYNHVAFKIPDELYPVYEARIHALGLERRPSRPRRKGEARSIYFYDYDNHLFELHTGELEERMKYYLPQA